MKRFFVMPLVLVFGLILTGCPPKKVVLPEPVEPVVMPEVVEEEVVEVKPVVEPEVKPEVVEVVEVPIVKVEPVEPVEPVKVAIIKFEDIRFDFDKYAMRPEARPTLRAIADWMLKNPAAKILVEGHCCEIGTNEYNLALGDRRAKATKDYLVVLGVASGRIKMVSYGEERPFCIVSKEEECLRLNRRAHFVITE